MAQPPRDAEEIGSVWSSHYGKRMEVRLQKSTGAVWVETHPSGWLGLATWNECEHSTTKPAVALDLAKALLEELDVS